MILRYFLPHNLNLNDLIDENRPNFKPFNRERAKYLLHLISSVRHHKKGLLTDDFVKLSSKSMQHKVHNYKKYWDYFINDLKIVERNDSYQVNKNSKGYRFVEKYRVPISASKDQIQDTWLRRKIILNLNEINQSVKGIPYLNKWFNEKLEINFDVAYKLIEQEYQLKKDNFELWDYDYVKKKHKNPLNQRNHALMSLIRFRDKFFVLKRDKNVKRYHSILTNMKSVLRNAVTYDGQRLVTLDVTNSQVYLSTVLLSSDYLIKCEAGKGITIDFNDPKTLFSFYSNKSIQCNTIIQHKYNNSSTYIMLGLFNEALASSDVQEYIQLAVGGQFYETLAVKCKEKLGLEFKSRKEIKTAMFQVLFTANRYIGLPDARPKKLFSQLFPEVYKVLSDIKRIDKTVLPRLLQSIESYLIVDVIAKRVSEEFPEAPIFTIHDSITTTEEYVEDVERIMMEELATAIGHPPKLDREYWDVSNIYEYMDKLTEQSKSVA